MRRTMLQTVLVVTALLGSATHTHVSVALGAHVSDATRTSPFVAAVFETSAPIEFKDADDDFYRLEFRAVLTGIVTSGGPELSGLISARFALAYVSMGLATELRPVFGSASPPSGVAPRGFARTDLAWATGPSFGVRLLDRDDVLLRVAFHWLPFGTTFNATRSVAELWGGWRIIGFQLSGSPMVFETTPTARAFFSAALCLRWQT